MHKECYARYLDSHRALANWKQADFQAVVIDGKPFMMDEKASLKVCLLLACSTGSVELFFRQPTDEEVPSITAADKAILQNYGRPYSSNNKPTGILRSTTPRFSYPFWM